MLGPLFNDVQSAKLFPDQKTFADAVPKSDPLMILADYRMQQAQSSFDLRHFVEMNFTLPAEGEKYVPPAGQSLREHIDDLWPVLTRTTDKASNKWDSLLPLPKPYVVPADVSARSTTGTAISPCWAWQRAITGTKSATWWITLRMRLIPSATFQRNRSYYLSRSQPPFFSMMVELLATHDSDALKKYRPQMEKEYAYWMDGVDALQPGQANKRVVKLDDGAILNRYWDDRDTRAGVLA